MDEIKKTYLSTDIKAILILVAVFTIILAGLYFIDVKTNYLTSLAASIMSGIK